MDALTTLPVRRVPFSADIEKPGDYCFISKREPVRNLELVIPNPRNVWQASWWLIRSAFGFYPAPEVKNETVEIRWPDYDAIILLCPHCSQPIATTKDHRIVSLEPLTIEKPLACVYSRDVQRDSQPTVFFTIKDGNIMPA
jgi:hypothetical protein